MEYLVGYIYDGDVHDLKPVSNIKEAEEYVFDLIGDEDYEEDEWQAVYSSDMKVKHYYIDYNQIFIIDLGGEAGA